MSMFKKDYIIGLDIGWSSIKMVQFKKADDGLHLVRAEVRELGKNVDQEVDEKVKASILKDLLKGIDIKNSRVIATINCPQTAIKIAHVPYMPKSELDSGIKLEAKNYFPFPIDECLIEYKVLGDTVEKGVRKYEIAVSVSPNTTVSKHISLLGSAGITPFSLVPCPLALEKLAEGIKPTEEGSGNRTLCFIDIGARSAELVIFKGTDLMFSRKIPVVGQDFTKSMMGVLVSDRGKTELSFDEAEKVKREVGIPGEGQSAIVDDKISTTQIISMMRNPLEQLVTEIDRCFAYYREESGGEKIDSVILFGGGAYLSGLVKFLSGELGVPVKLGDSLEGFKLDPAVARERGNLSHRLEFAIGAALTEGKGINLLPPEMKQKTKSVVRRGTIEAIVTGALLTSLLFYIGMNIQLDNFGKRIKVAKRELAGLDPLYKKAEAHHLANMVLVDEPHWEDIFKELSHIIPKDIHLSNMSMKNKIITMKGIVASEEGENLLSDFILSLEKGIFKDVKLVNTRDLPGGEGNEFELQCWVD